MAHRRFLRDGTLDGLIKVVEEYIHALDEDAPDYKFHYINSLLVSYKTSKVALERIEESIEYARANDPTGEICSTLAEAAMHIQTGVLSLHESLKINTSPPDEDFSLADFS